MKIFDFENNNLFLNKKEILLVKEFKDIWESDKTKDKKEAYKAFTYLYLVCDFGSPIRDLENKEEKALESSGLKQIDEKIKKAIEIYNQINYSKPTLKMIANMNKAIEELGIYFKTVNFTEKVQSGARKGTLLYDPKELMVIMKQAEIILDQVKKLEKRAIEEMKAESQYARGGVEIGYDE